jgi:hypothetical protein
MVVLIASALVAAIGVWALDRVTLQVVLGVVLAAEAAYLAASVWVGLVGIVLAVLVVARAQGREKAEAQRRWEEIRRQHPLPAEKINWLQDRPMRGAGR